MNVNLSLSSDTLSDDAIQKVTYDLCRSLRQEIDSDAKIAESAATEAGIKGDSVTFGTIALSLLGSGGVVVTLIGLLKSYIDRGRHLKIKVAGKGGQTVELSADNLEPAQL